MRAWQPAPRSPAHLDRAHLPEGRHIVPEVSGSGAGVGGHAGQALRLALAQHLVVQGCSKTREWAAAERGRVWRWWVMVVCGSLLLLLLVVVMVVVVVDMPCCLYCMYCMYLR